MYSPVIPQELLVAATQYSGVSVRRGITSSLEGMDSVSEVLPLTLLQHFLLLGIPGLGLSYSPCLLCGQRWDVLNGMGLTFNALLHLGNAKVEIAFTVNAAFQHRFVG